MLGLRVAAVAGWGYPWGRSLHPLSEYPFVRSAIAQSCEPAESWLIQHYITRPEADRR